jgi:hypothetical protein
VDGVAGHHGAALGRIIRGAVEISDELPGTPQYGILWFEGARAVVPDDKLRSITDVCELEQLRDIVANGTFA